MLKSQIQENLKAALRGKREAELSVLRMLLTSVGAKETEKRTRIWKEKPDLTPEVLQKESQLTDEEITEAISSEIKKRREAIELYLRGDRQDLAGREKEEMEILQKYLPEQLSEEEIRKLVKTAIAKIGAKEQKDMGKTMAELMPKIKGRADGTLVSKIIKELLGSKNG